MRKSTSIDSLTSSIQWVSSTTSTRPGLRRANEAAFARALNRRTDAHPDQSLEASHPDRRSPAGHRRAPSPRCRRREPGRVSGRGRSARQDPRRQSPRATGAPRHEGADWYATRQNAVNTSTPREPAIAETSRTRRLLPMPGDPTRATTAPWPSTARCSRPSAAAISRCRPTRLRLSTPDERDAVPSMPNSRWAVTG